MKRHYRLEHDLLVVDEWMKQCKTALAAQDKRDLLLYASVFLRLANDSRMEPTDEGRKIIRKVQSLLFDVESEFESGRAVHMEDVLGRARPRYWRRPQRDERKEYEVVEFIRNLRKKDHPTPDVFWTAGKRFGVSASHAEKWFYAAQRTLKDARAMPRRRRRNQPSIIAECQFVKLVDPSFSHEVSKTSEK